MNAASRLENEGRSLGERKFPYNRLGGNRAMIDKKKIKYFMEFSLQHRMEKVELFQKVLTCLTALEEYIPQFVGWARISSSCGFAFRANMHEL